MVDPVDLAFFQDAASLAFSARAEIRSEPNGFSTTTRRYWSSVSLVSPAASSCETMMPKKREATAR